MVTSVIATMIVPPPDYDALHYWLERNLTFTLFTEFWKHFIVISPHFWKLAYECKLTFRCDWPSKKFRIRRWSDHFLGSTNLGKLWQISKYSPKSWGCIISERYIYRYILRFVTALIGKLFQINERYHF